jgi:cellulose synthase/poly-beta-1,6-N-acetylglucosamine synthase-like glycosyltransferase
MTLTVDGLLQPLFLAPPGAGGLGLANNLLFVVLFCALVDFVKLLVELLGRNDERPFSSDASIVTAVIPSRNGRYLLPQTIQELSVRIAPARVLVIDDGSTDDTAAVSCALGCEVHRFEKSKGKAGAINYAVHQVRTPLTLLLDDDTRMGGARIPTSLVTEDGYTAVAFHVLPDRRNRDGSQGNNFLGALQRYEYGKSMEIGKRFHDFTLSVSCVSGAAGLFRTADLDRLHHRHTGVFPAEDLQRTIIALLDGGKIVFANEPVWTVAPHTVGGWVRQRLWGWYPGLYHQVANFLRLLFHPRVPWRLRYEMLYNLYTFVSDPLKTFSIVMIAITPGLRWWGLAVYLMYLAFELYPWWVVRVPYSSKRAPLGVLLFYPIYGGINTLLRMFSALTWFWMRYVTREMKPRRGPGDRIE